MGSEPQAQAQARAVRAGARGAGARVPAVQWPRGAGARVPALQRARRTLARLGTLRVRLTIAVAILAAIGLTGGGALVVHAVETTVIRAIEEQSRDELHVIGGQIAEGVPLTEIRAPGPGRVVSFRRPDGTEVETHRFEPCQGAPPPPLPPPPPRRVRFDPGAPAREEIVSCFEPPLPPPPSSPRIAFGHGRRTAWSVVEMPLLSPKEGPLHAVALSPLEDVLRSTETLQRVLTLGVPVLVGLLVLASWVLVGRALRPVRVMTQQAAGIADATAPERLAVPAAQDELGELARTLNGMLDRLAEGAQRQREFVSDASHELRSPIAATRAQIEVALAHPGRADHAVVLRGVLAETLRLEVLAADLLLLARLDERQALPHEELDLDDLVLEEAARSRAVPVDTRRVTAVKVHGDQKSLGHLVRNLLDNAARHAATRVEVALQIEGGAPVLLVDDDGPGIPEADRARVFERFTRLSSSRSRDGGGAGLGLALVRRVAEQHGGAVRIDRAPLGGARLEVRFPPDAAPGSGGDAAIRPAAS
ncbi:MAG TPA: HAMP domain-containing sensor histidine kinase [Kofleriaceae bacterium]|nr:HAMP domain-containing sensor histidine kinase [Kofleriaceae bacterium]